MDFEISLSNILFYRGPRHGLDDARELLLPPTTAARAKKQLSWRRLWARVSDIIIVSDIDFSAGARRADIVTMPPHLLTRRAQALL